MTSPTRSDSVSLTADQALAGATSHHSLAQPGSSIEEIASQLIGLHNTSQVSPYLSLRTRLPGFRRTDLDGLMWDSWQLVRLRAMRLTMFVFPRELLGIVAAATRPLGEQLVARWWRDSDLSQRDFERLAARVEAALGERPMTVRELRQTLKIPAEIDLPGVVGRMCDMGRLVGGGPPGSWRSNIRRYHRWLDVLPDVDLHHWDEEPAIRELILRYIRSYGPVTINDISWWTGFTKQQCRKALAALDIEEVAVDGWPGPLFRVAGENTGDQPGSEVHALPLLDPYVQGYKDRIRFLEPALHDCVYDGGGNATATLVQGGRIIGVWQTSDQPGKSVRYHLFGDSPQSTRRAAESELTAVGSLYFDRAVDVIEIPAMKPLSSDGGRSASHPLDSTLHRASRRRQR